MTNKKTKTKTKKAKQVDLAGEEVPILVDHLRVTTHRFEAEHFKVNLTKERINKWSQETKDGLRDRIMRAMRPQSHVRSLPDETVKAELDALTERVSLWLNEGAA